MAKQSETIKFKLVVNAPAREVFESFTNASALTDWLCNVAEADGRRGGRLYLWWNTGYFASGEFVNLEPGKKIVFSWHGAGEVGNTRVKVELEAAKTGTLVYLSHSGLGAGKDWAKARRSIKRGWRDGLANLKSVLETGLDLRFRRRPDLGVSGLEDISAEQAGQLGLPARACVRVLGVLDGQGAQAAGLQAGDLVIKMAGKRVDSKQMMWSLMQQYQAGDQVKMVFYRDGQRQRVKLQLSHLPLPDVPASLDELVEVLQQEYQACQSQLARALQAASDEQAGQKPAEEQWSAKEVIAHLINTERELHSLIASFLVGQQAEFTFYANQPAFVSATVAAWPLLDDLLDELRRSQEQTLAMAAGLPPEFAVQKRSYWRLGSELLGFSSHTCQHIAQIESTLRAAGVVQEVN
ncbi:MAG: SRPBCC domain-containing protein [Chloroflexota bacterium]